MKKLMALLLLAAALYLFLPLASPLVKKSPKALFLESLISASRVQDGRCETELKLKIPTPIPLKLGVFDGKSTRLRLSLSSVFSKKSGLFASTLCIKPESSAIGKPFTDIVVGGGRLYMNLHTVFEYLLSASGEKLNYSLFFSSDYLYFSFQQLASLSPETAGVFLIGLSIQKCISEPLSPLSRSLNAQLDERLFSSSESTSILTLDNASFSKLASVLLEDINSNSQEYAKRLIAAAYPDAKSGAPDKSVDTLAAEIKSWSAKTLAALSSSQDMSASVSVARLGTDKNFALSFSLSGESEGLKIDCEMRLSETAPENISVPEKAMNAEELFGTPAPRSTELYKKQGITNM